MLCAMFIRRTRTGTGERGEVYYSHRLVRSERDGGQIRQRTLLNLGSDFPVERRHWAVLCSRIQQQLDRQAELVPLSCPEEVERHAQRIAAQLLNSAPSGGTGRPDLQTVDVGSLELIRPRSVGVEHVGLWAMERTYTSLTDVEAVFRSLKSELGLRPIFHQTQRRSDGHLFITVIAYQMVQTIRRRLAQQGEYASWASLRAILEGQQRVTATFRRKDGRTLHVRKATRAEPEQQEIYRALGIDPAPGGIRKMIV